MEIAVFIRYDAADYDVCREFGYACVALTGGLLAIRNVVTIGDIQAFIQYVKNFTQPIQQIAQVINMVQSMSAASERVFEFLNEEEEDQTTENPADIGTVTGAVTFDHVQFGYNPDQIIIHDFCAKVKPGQKIAIVGPTGAGKTTMVKLLMRYYDVNSGAILLDDHNIRDFNRRELRDAFGMVLQDTWLFKGSIMENIRYGRSMPRMRRLLQRRRLQEHTISFRPCRAATRWS